jgi:hypothetical protein
MVYVKMGDEDGRYFLIMKFIVPEPGELVVGTAAYINEHYFLPAGKGERRGGFAC